MTSRLAVLRGRAFAVAATLLLAAVLVAVFADPSWAGPLPTVGDKAHKETAPLFKQLWYVGLGAGCVMLFKRWGALLAFFACMLLISPAVFTPEHLGTTFSDVANSILP